MANKKINELDSRASLSLSDLMVVGDASTGYAYKTTLTDIKTLIGGGVVSFNGRVGAVVPTEGDYSLTQLSDVIITSVSAGQVLRYNGTSWVNATESYVGTVTSVSMTVPTGFSVSGSPITSSGTLGLTFAAGYALPTTTKQGQWDTAYDRSLTAAAVSGTTTKTLTLTKQDGTTLTATWSDINTDAVTSVFGRTGAIVATEGDYSLDLLSDVTITTPSSGQVLKYNGTAWVNDSDAGGITSMNGLTALTQTLATGTSGTDFNISSTTSTHTFNIPTASAINRGLLSSTDWTTFNNKQNALTNPVTGTGTNNYLSKFTGTSTLGDSSIFDDGSGIGIGTTSLTGYDLRVSSNITGSTISNAVAVDGTIQSDVTNQARLFVTTATTQVATFTLGTLYHYGAFQGTFGAGSTVNVQYGYFVSSGLTGATNNYGFYSNLASGTGRWNMYMNGTAPNYMAGSLGIGNTGNLGFVNLAIQKTITGNVVGLGVSVFGAVQSDVTARAEYFGTSASTQAATFTLASLNHYRADQGTFGAGSTVTTQNGFVVAATLIGATNNYGFRGLIPSGANRWNLFMDGTASNHINGRLLLGTTTDNTVDQLQINGSVIATTLKKSGGTSSEILAADGSVITAGTNITISGGNISASGGIQSVTSDQMVAISSPTNGQLVYKTDGYQGMYQYIEDEWQPLIMNNELIVYNGNQGSNGILAPFTTQNSGTASGGSVTAFPNNFKTHPIQYNTGTTSTGYAGLYTNTNSGMNTTGKLCFRAIIRTPTALSDATDTYTITIGNGVLPSNGYGQGTFGFSYKYDVNGGNWTAFRSNSAATVDTGIAVAANTKYILEIEYISSTSIKFYIDNVLVATISSSVPTSSSSSYIFGAGINKSAGTNTRLLTIGSIYGRKVKY